MPIVCHAHLFFSRLPPPPLHHPPTHVSRCCRAMAVSSVHLYSLPPYSLIQPFSGAHPRRWGWILQHLSSRNESFDARGPGASHSAFPGFSPSTSVVVPMLWPAMLLMFTANPRLPKLDPLPDRPSLVHFLASSPRAPPPALWSGHHNGSSAAGMNCRGLPAIPAASGPFEFSHFPALTSSRQGSQRGRKRSGM